MLVLTRKLNERIRIGKDIEIVITDIRPDLVRIGIEAPRNVQVHRGEVFSAIEESNRSAALSNEGVFNLELFRDELAKHNEKS